MNWRLRLWQIKDKKQRQAEKITGICACISIAVSLMAGCVLPLSLIGVVILFVLIYLLLTYTVLGISGCYRTNRFRGHLFLRWAALVLMGLAVLYQIALFVFQEYSYKEFFVGFCIFVFLLICSIQCVRNGYRS